jgi:MinD-like ATPase involved in chromosome partitioning or flagellar assembly
MSVDRSTVRDALRQALCPEVGFVDQLAIRAPHYVNVRVVSPRFAALDHAARRAAVAAVVAPFGFQPGFLTTHDIEEADLLGLVEETETSPPWAASEEGTWASLGAALLNLPPGGTAAALEDHPQSGTPGKPRVYVFYSFKGGVGRTTLLIHTAMELARSGKRVGIIDLDLEAPGFGDLLRWKDAAPPPVGVLEWLWCAANSLPSPPVTDLFAEVALPTDHPGRVYAVPAGSFDAAFLTRLSTLREQDVARGPWSRFVQTLNEQLPLDAILVDSRTGFSAWAAFCLLVIPDQVVVVTRPDPANRGGVSLVLRGLASLGRLDRTQVALSMVPATAEGTRRAAAWRKDLLQDLGKADDPDLETLFLLPEVKYDPSAAVADELPHPSFARFTAALTGSWLGGPAGDRIAQELSRVHRRTVLKSLRFRGSRAEDLQPEDLDAIFTRPSQSVDLLNPRVPLVRGRKGTGKSLLYRVFTQRPDLLRKSPGSGLMPTDTVISGHGNHDWHPGRGSLAQLDTVADRSADGWTSVWRALLLQRLRPLLRTRPRSLPKELWDVLPASLPKPGAQRTTPARPASPATPPRCTRSAPCTKGWGPTAKSAACGWSSTTWTFTSARRPTATARSLASCR